MCVGVEEGEEEEGGKKGMSELYVCGCRRRKRGGREEGND